MKLATVSSVWILSILLLGPPAPAQDVPGGPGLLTLDLIEGFQLGSATRDSRPWLDLASGEDQESTPPREAAWRPDESLTTLDLSSGRDPGAGAPDTDPTTLPVSLAYQSDMTPDEIDMYRDIERRSDPTEDPRRKKKKKRGPAISTTFNLIGYPWTEFKLSDLTAKWDTAARYELEIAGHFPIQDHAEPYGAAYFFFEDRDWSQATSYVSYHAWGFGFELGALLYPTARADEKDINLSLVPFLRLGLGFNGGDFGGFTDENGDDVSGTLGNARWEAALGLEARAILFRRVSLGLGAGFAYWDSFNVDARVVNTGTAVVRFESVAFRGKDAFVRLTIGILW